MLNLNVCFKDLGCMIKLGWCTENLVAVKGSLGCLFIFIYSSILSCDLALLRAIEDLPLFSEVFYLNSKLFYSSCIVSNLNMCGFSILASTLFLSPFNIGFTLLLWVLIEGVLSKLPVSLLNALLNLIIFCLEKPSS